MNRNDKEWIEAWRELLQGVCDWLVAQDAEKKVERMLRTADKKLADASLHEKKLRGEADQRYRAGQHEPDQAGKLGHDAVGLQQERELALAARDLASEQLAHARDRKIPAEMAWKQLWREEISLLVIGLDDKAADVVTIEALLSKGRPEGPAWPLKARLHAPQKHARRLLKMIDLIPMVEERTFGDYRIGLEQQLEVLQGEAVSTRQGAEMALQVIQELKLQVTECGNRGAALSIDNLKTLESVIENAQCQATELITSIGQPVFRDVLADALRPLWTQVNGEFGTWPRRIKPPLVWFAASTSAALILYVIAGSFFPTELLLWPLLWAAAGLAVYRYYRTRDQLNSLLQQGREDLDDLNPDLEVSPESPRPTWLWSATKDSIRAADGDRPPSAAISEGIRRLQRRGEEEEPPTAKLKQNPLALVGRRIHSGVKAAAILIGTPIVLVLAWALLSSIVSLAPTYAAIGRSMEKAECLMATGAVLWSGPSQVIMVASSGGPVVIPSSSILRLERLNDQPTKCSDRSTSAAGANDLLHAIHNRPQHELALVLPIFADPVTCSPLVQLSAESVNFVSSLGKAMLACTDRRPVSIDVRGFASAKTFEDCGESSDRLNLALAENRRKTVVDTLRSVIPKERMVIELEGQPRLNDSIDAMRKQIVFNDGGQGSVRERLVRYVEIRVKDPADCGPMP